jgi:hypothetical protein
MTFYDPVRPGCGYEYSGRLSCPGTMGPPLCLAELQQEAGGGPQAPRLVWGDTGGCVGGGAAARLRESECRLLSCHGCAKSSASACCHKCLDRQCARRTAAPAAAEGAVMLLKADPPPLHCERQLAPRRDYDVLHSGHTDWVTCLQHIPGGWAGESAWGAGWGASQGLPACPAASRQCM